MVSGIFNMTPLTHTHRHLSYPDHDLMRFSRFVASLRHHAIAIITKRQKGAQEKRVETVGTQTQDLIKPQDNI